MRIAVPILIHPLSASTPVHSNSPSINSIWHLTNETSALGQTETPLEMVDDGGEVGDAAGEKEGGCERAWMA